MNALLTPKNTSNCQIPPTRAPVKIGLNSYKKLMPKVIASITYVKIGPRTNNVSGTTINSVNIGTKIIFTISGITFRSCFSTTEATKAATIIGKTELV